MNGTLYGATFRDGDPTCSCGTVFAYAPGGQFSTLYAFTGKDGALASGGLTEINGTLFGTTACGGTKYKADNKRCTGYGVLFSLTQAGIETVVHNFSQTKPYPLGDLLARDGHLFGTTTGVGQSTPGTLFGIEANGKNYTTMHTFETIGDGQSPNGALIAVNGLIYGTTEAGGSNGFGTVFSIARNGVETVIYSFGGVSDGAYPFAGVIGSKGVLYGATENGGGKTGCGIGSGCGTVFSLAP
jgi:uncharacterized repeat protein (TIGR03803 family)